MKRKLFVATFFATAGYFAVQSIRKRNNLLNVAPKLTAPVKTEPASPPHPSKPQPEKDLTQNLSESEVDNLTGELSDLLDL